MTRKTGKKNMKKTKREITIIIICPNCSFEIDLDKYELKEQMECPSCKRTALGGRIIITRRK
jgi:hypothetical protein